MEKTFSERLLEHNGKEKQLAIIQGELAELITKISDYFYRDDKTEAKSLVKEMVDAILQLGLLELILSKDLGVSVKYLDAAIKMGLADKVAVLKKRMEEGTLR